MKKHKIYFTVLLMLCTSALLLSCAKKEECDFCGEMGVCEERSLFDEEFLVCEECANDFEKEIKQSDNSWLTFDEEYEEDESFKGNSEKPKEVDLFKDIILTFNGISPKANAKIDINSDSENLEILTSCYYNLDIQPRSNLKNGDKVVVTIKKPEQLLNGFNVIPKELSKEYIVDGLDSYVDSAEQIPKEMIEEFAKQYVQDTNYKLIDEDMWTYSDAKYYGSYLLWVKDGAWLKHTNELRIFVYYDGYVHGEYHSTTYIPLRFYDVVQKYNGNIIINYSDGIENVAFANMISHDENQDDEYEIIKLD